MKTKLCNHIANALPDSSTDTIAELLAVPPEESMGDFALPCFSFAKALRKSPALIAEDIKSALLPNLTTLGIDRIETVGGYCNFFFNRTAYAKDCLLKLQTETLGVDRPGTGKTVCPDGIRLLPAFLHHPSGVPDCGHLRIPQRNTLYAAV